MTEEKYTDITEAIFDKLKNGDVKYSIGENDESNLSAIPLEAELVIWREEARKKQQRNSLCS